jgi:ADP-ribose pyrophosphatase
MNEQDEEPRKPGGKKDILHEGRFLRLARIGTWEFVEPVASTGIVVVLPVTSDDHVVLIEQFRVPLARKVIELPAGLVGDSSRDESFEQAARRELLEETGFEAGRLDKLAEWPISSASNSSTLSFYLASLLVKRHAGGGDQYESIIVHEVPRDEVPRWLANREKDGYLVEPKIYSGLFLLQQQRGS